MTEIEKFAKHIIDRCYCKSLTRISNKDTLLLEANELSKTIQNSNITWPTQWYEAIKHIIPKNKLDLCNLYQKNNSKENFMKLREASPRLCAILSIHLNKNLCAPNSLFKIDIYTSLIDLAEELEMTDLHNLNHCVYQLTELLKPNEKQTSWNTSFITYVPSKDKWLKEQFEKK